MPQESVVFDVLEKIHYYLPVLMVFYPLGIFALVFWLIYHISGWKKLSQLHPLHMPFTESTYSWQQVNFGGVNFNNSMTLGANNYGIYFRPTTPFHFGFYKPILLPWAQIDIKQTKVFKMEVIEITPKALPKKVIKLNSRSYEKIKPIVDMHTRFLEEEAKTEF